MSDADKNLEDSEESYDTLEGITKAIKKSGVDNCGLIFGIDYTISNKLQGQKTFDGHSLHEITKDRINPYQEQYTTFSRRYCNSMVAGVDLGDHVICILGETLEPLDDDGIIHAFGFGDRKCKDTKVFPLKPEGECEGFAEVLDVYNEITPKIRMGGPTNFAPLIRKAMEIVRKNKEYHILVIVADGQVTSEEETIQAIVDASNYPLSIVVIGVGDGPWSVMNDLDEKLPSRKFDNFQFVDFHQIKASARSPQSAIAIEALSEVPEQYRAIKQLKLLEKL